METIILWLLLIVGIVLLILTIIKPSRKESLLTFFMSAYFSIYLGTLVTEENLISYPIKLFTQFRSSILFEYLLFPVLTIYFYNATKGSGFFSTVLQSAIYSAVLTILEVLLEKNTYLIEYIHWKWYYTFISEFIFLLIIRFLMKLINGRNG